MTQKNLVNQIDLIASVLKDKLNKKRNLIIAIDGPCASGKTTLAQALKEMFNCNVIPVDDFFLQPHQRTQERLDTPGGNFDKARLIKEVITPLKNGAVFSYRPYDCKTGTLSEPVMIEPKALTLIEGVYACHPELSANYDIRIFVKTDKATQLERLKKRSPRMLNRFIFEWIPMEEKYFSVFKIEDVCDFVIET
jgi:uridine kinase